MPRRTDLSDDELTGELRRRAGEPTLGADWARVELLPAIRSAAPAVSSKPVRLARLAGLTAVAAAVLVLVVSVPLLGPGLPPATPSPAAPSSAVALSAGEFASRVAAGQLRGETVLVTAAIESGPPVPRPFCTGLGPCYMGQLVGTGPVPLTVVSAYTPAIDGNVLHVDDEIDWSSWFMPQPPVQGILVLSVDEEGQVVYLGRTLGDNLSHTLSGARELDLESLALDQVVVVSGWLTTPGLGGFSCNPPLPGTHIEGLPGRWCGSPAWVVDRPLVLDPRSGYFPPTDGIQIQNGAYFDFAFDRSPGATPNVDPRAGTYALARRLEGSGCPDQKPPCWQWNVVARIHPLTVGPAAPLPSSTPNSTSQPPSPLPTPDPAMIIECPEPPRDSIHQKWGHAIVHDETGLVASCDTVDATDFSEFIQAANPPDEPDVVRVFWSGSPCDAQVDFRFRQTADGYTLDGETYAGICRLPLISHEIQLNMRADVDAAAITVSRTVVPPPEPTPSPSDPGSRTFTCPYPESIGRETEMHVTDHTGRITGCTADLNVGDPPDTVAVANGSEVATLDVTWVADSSVDPCYSRPVDLELWGPVQVSTPDQRRYALSVATLSGVLTDPCRQAPRTQSVTLTLNEPIEPADVEAFLSEQDDVGNSNSSEDVVDTGQGQAHLLIVLPWHDYSAGEPIHLQTERLYQGGTDELGFSSRGPLFSYEQLNGGMASLPAAAPECSSVQLRRGAGEPTDLDLTLPAGTYRLRVRWIFGLGGCGTSANEFTLDTSVVIHVR